jgi:hypothetical protein
MRLRVALFTAGFALCAMALGNAFYPAAFAPLTGQAAGQDETAKLQQLVAQLPQPLTLPQPQKTAGCAVDGPYPDRACTPGAVFAAAGVQQICTPGYSEGVRSVSTSLKKKIYAAYGIAYPQPTGTYELDHFVPLELGGDNSAANLFPEAASPTPGFKEKDVVEDYLHDEVCAGAVSLPAAQKQIASDWVAVYDTLSPETISAIKQKYASWAD